MQHLTGNLQIVIAPGHPTELSPGFKFPFDNFDIRQNVRDMTEDNQNKDIHWVNHNAIIW